LNGNYSELKAFMDDYQTDIRNLTNFYKKHTTYAPEIIEEKLSKGDWYIRVSEALSNGIVHKIITDITELL
jgi:ATP-dependent protease ClpP protease subunit